MNWFLIPYRWSLLNFLGYFLVNNLGKFQLAIKLREYFNFWDVLIYTEDEKMFALKNDILMIWCLILLGHFWTYVCNYQRLLSASYRSYYLFRIPSLSIYKRGRMGGSREL